MVKWIKLFPKYLIRTYLFLIIKNSGCVLTKYAFYVWYDIISLLLSETPLSPLHLLVTKHPKYCPFQSFTKLPKQGIWHPYYLCYSLCAWSCIFHYFSLNQQHWHYLFQVVTKYWSLVLLAINIIWFFLWKLCLL